jgi:hypothetical protein
MEFRGTYKIVKFATEDAIIREKTMKHMITNICVQSVENEVSADKKLHVFTKGVLAVDVISDYSEQVIFRVEGKYLKAVIVERALV